MGKKLANVSITLEQPLPLKKMWRNTCNKILLFPLKVPSSVAVSIFTSLYNHHYLISELLQHLKRKPHTIKALPFPLWINLLFWFFLWPLGTQGTVLWAWPQPAACFVWRAGDVWETSSREKGRGSKKNKEEEERWMGVEEDSFRIILQVMLQAATIGEWELTPNLKYIFSSPYLGGEGGGSFIPWLSSTGDLFIQPGMEPVPPAVECKVLPTGLPASLFFSF